MNTLFCDPIVFTIEKDYMIGIMTEENGLIQVELDGKIYRESECGTLTTHKRNALIRVPGDVLNRVKKYTVTYRSCKERLNYFTKMGDEERFDYTFRPVLKDEGIRIYHCADVHDDFENSKRCISYLEDMDLLVLNGDIVEPSKDDNFRAAYKFISDVTKGEIPVLYTRGNHDTRGAMADRYRDYFPTIDGKCFFKVEIGNMECVVLDCGEDKPDTHEAYGGVNDFSTYRRIEAEYLKNIDMTSKDKWRICFSHICPNATTLDIGDIFDIEREVYTEFTKELERMKIDCMFCGHIHEFKITLPDDSKSTLKATVPANYPIFTGSRRTRKPDAVGESRHSTTYTSGGCVMIVNKDDMRILYTGFDKDIISEFTIKRGDLDSFKQIK